MLKTISSSSLFHILICIASAGPLKSKANKVIVDDVAFYKLGTYRGFTDDGAEYQKTFFFSRYSESFWAESKAICNAFKMELASMETLAEANALLTMADNHSFLRAVNDIIIWIDGIALSPISTTDWYWSNSGEKINFPIPWVIGQPSSTDQRCLSIHKAGINQKFGFNDFHCSDSYFIYLFVDVTVRKN
ncbi:hypothetical protein ACKWTF_008862 [Chironomus riparius]